MEIEVQRTRNVKLKITVQFPFYASNGCHYAFFKNENECIVIYPCKEIQILRSKDYVEWMRWRKSRKEVFDKKLNETINSISKLNK
jgi:hypothetical protein